MSPEINFTIVIPHHNMPDLLERCVNSIPQRCDLEVIVVDDASDPLKVDFDNLSFLKREDVQFIRVLENKGPGHARNIGIDKAKGKWMIFCDSDDFFTSELPSFLDKYKDSEADMIYFQATSVSSDTLLPSDRHHYHNSISQSKNEKMRRYFHFVPWCKMVKRDMLLRNNIRFDEVLYAADVTFSAEAGYYAKDLRTSDDIVYCITARDGLESNPSLERAFGVYAVWIRRNLFLKEKGVKKAYVSIYRSIINITKKGGIRAFFKALAIARKYKINPLINNIIGF